MRPLQLPPTSPVTQNPHGGNFYPEQAENAVHPIDRSCDDDSGFFDNVVQQQKTTASTLKSSVATGNTIFGKEDVADGDLRKKIDEAFERHQAVPANDNEKDICGAKASKITPQANAHHVSPLSGKHKQGRDDPDILPPSSAHGEAAYEHATGNDDTAADDGTDSEATSDEDVGTSGDYEEPSPPDSDTFLKRELGEDSQLVSQISTASLFQRASGQESQEIPNMKWLN